MKRLSTVVLISTALLLQACGGSSGDSFPGNSMANSGQDATSVEVTEVASSDISRQYRSYGTIESQEMVEVTPQVSNRITQIHADLGDTVSQGQVLAEIYEVPFRDAYQQAQSQVEQNRSAYRRDSLQFVRQRQLFEQDLISSTEFENARATFQSSKAALQSAVASMTQSRENLQNTDITSPVRGVVVTRNVSEGDLAGTGTVAYEVATLTGYEASIYLPVEEWQNVQIGHPVNVRVSNRQEIAGQGRVTRKSPRIDPTTGLGEVIISLNQAGPGIYPGVLVRSEINVETHEGAVVIPRSALVENVQTLIEPESNTIQLERTYSVFVTEGDSLARRSELELGIEQGDHVEVLSGLQPGDRIVVTGQQSLEDGARISIAGQQPSPGSPASEGERSIETVTADSAEAGAASGSAGGNRP
ncbi:MAG: efflux RND transporter periplasmic adaptor subunit [Balneolaceae bacterium]|nr:efflux RND transporter periplasmic adaptor subunit [Balneolaceae bacterium]